MEHTDNRKKDILNVLKKTRQAIQNKDYPAIAEASNHIIHDASIYQDNSTVHTAIVIYALSKVMQKGIEKQITLPIQIDDAISAVEKNDYEAYKKELKKISSILTKADEKITNYVTEVLEKAKLKKGYKLHTHGLSTARTAEILGISQWELQNYIGKTIEEGKTQDRLQIARQLFK